MSEQTLAVHAPYNGAVVGHVAISTEADVEQALTVAHGLFRDRDQWLSKPRRIEILHRAAELIGERKVEIATQAASEGGKPLKDSLAEVERGIDGILNSIEVLRSEGGHVIPMGLNAASANRVAFTQFEPIGVVAAVSAFNHPFNLIVHQVIPAIAVSAPVIVKPAANTPLSCQTLIDILAEAGLPKGWAQMVLPTDNAITGKLVSDPRVGFFSFIGSAAVGWMLRSTLAPGTRCALEHGGAAPVMLTADADLDDALPRIARGSFFHAGQVCVSVQRIFCHRSIAEQVAVRLGQMGDAMVVGDPTDPRTDVGPLIAEREVNRVSQWVNDAVAGGARLISGGRALDNNCYAPTVLLNPSIDSNVMQKEVFGPVVAVYAYDTLSDAIQLANALPYAFQAAVFTQNLDTAMQCYQDLNATAVMVNESTTFRVDWMPFAGASLSGHGVGGIPHTMKDMQVEKMMVWRSRAVRG
ncbi:aldehyde dehydrogenase family protein [Pseudomonas sp. PCH199]|uniref:aldehyde dehydrogenase family protein n=1 Tax=unclassified Pseudomonas TaxID=196821 RepID=UPI000BC9505C|nr:MULTISPECIES: aldehyde dehydrogenase family protein [unclassified Pseudomonas]MCW8277381.1 aldehyde dehydrogenase family protein [Pseudomonas sp. PCH199]PAM82321.1 aldehyde dehydrogenase [Pseudomonas sp. ERMR1:02]